MNAELAIAGGLSLALAFGHITIGRRWVIRGLSKEQFPRTPFGPRSLSLGMMRFTWNVVSVMLLAFGVLFIVLAAAPHANPKTLALRWLAVFWSVATAAALWEARHRPRTVLRFPIPVLLAVITVMCWAASP